MNINDRVKYYLGDLYNEEIVNTDFKDKQSNKNIFPPNVMKKVTVNDIQKICSFQRDAFHVYGIPMINITFSDDKLKKYVDKNILFRWGDWTIPLNKNDYYITKAKTITDKNAIILKLAVNRHWENIKVVKQNDISFKYKNNILVWRGATTGINGDYETNRLLAVKTLFNKENCDVGFSVCCQGHHPLALLKNHIDIRSMLSYKYHLVLEGNDVASGLKWQLYSNSVVFMRKPTKVSWAMEDMLEPFIHYIPIKDDFSDVGEMIEWANNNQEKCETIANNASIFIEQFLNPERELLIQQMVLKKYFETVNIS